MVQIWEPTKTGSTNRKIEKNTACLFHPQKTYTVFCCDAWKTLKQYGILNTQLLWFGFGYKIIFFFYIEKVTG